MRTNCTSKHITSRNTTVSSLLLIKPLTSSNNNHILTCCSVQGWAYAQWSISGFMTSTKAQNMYIHKKHKTRIELWGQWLLLTVQLLQDGKNLSKIIFKKQPSAKNATRFRYICVMPCWCFAPISVGCVQTPILYCAMANHFLSSFVVWLRLWYEPRVYNKIIIIVIANDCKTHHYRKPSRCGNLVAPHEDKWSPLDGAHK